MSANLPGFTRALVTGGAGFIGSHLVDRLVGMGIETISVDNYSAGKPSNLAHLAGVPHFTAVDCDVTDRDRLGPYLDGVDIIFHQAASKKTVCLADPRRDLAVNAEGTFNLLEGAVRRGVRKFVHASTGSVYGESVYRTDERHPIAPTSFYGVSKFAGESYVRAFAHMHGLDTTVLRYFHVYGPRQESSDVGGVVSIFCRRLLEGKPLVIHGDGTQVRSFTYVDDVVDANIRAATVPEARGQVFNCASGIKVTIAELANKIAQSLGSSPPVIEYDDWLPGDIRNFDIENGRIREVLGLEFMTDFDRGLALTLAWAQRFFGRTTSPHA
jgi:UDP-glucose 4-epimerase